LETENAALFETRNRAPPALCHCQSRAVPAAPINAKRRLFFDSPFLNESIEKSISGCVICLAGLPKERSN
jgi:hypothetical protein